MSYHFSIDNNFKSMEDRITDDNLSLILESLDENFDDDNFSGVLCPICNRSSYLFLPFRKRKHVYCPSCNSGERHRFLYIYLKNKTDILQKNCKVLHFAPEQIFHELFSKNENIDYYPVDIKKCRNIVEIVDMCQIQYPDNSFDVILANHILEHIPDDIQAMSELYRVVRPESEGGVVILTVPYFRNLKKTFENEEYNTPELRLKHFGQSDHVRKYGLDFVDRLMSVGFTVAEVRSTEHLSEELLKKYGIFDRTIFICKKK